MSAVNISVNCGGNQSDSAPVMAIPIKVLVTVLFAFVIFLATTGNSIVCYIVLRESKISVTNLFLLNLSLADMLMALLCAPFTLVADVLYLWWPFGSVMCKVVPYAQGVSVFISALTHVVISCDRFVLVHFPLRPRITRKCALVTLAGVWTLALAIPLPLPLVSQTRVYEGGVVYCIENWNWQSQGPDASASNNQVYSIALLILQYFLPLSVIAGTYAAIAVKIWGKRIPGECDIKRDQRIIQAKKKMVKMVILVAAFYGVSQLPRHVVYLIGLTYDCLYTQPGVSVVLSLCHVSSISATCYNPLIYCWMNKTFRLGFKQVLSCFLPTSWRVRRSINGANNTFDQAGDYSCASPACDISLVAKTAVNRRNTSGNALQVTSGPGNNQGDRFLRPDNKASGQAEGSSV